VSHLRSSGILARQHYHHLSLRSLISSIFAETTHADPPVEQQNPDGSTSEPLCSVPVTVVQGLPAHPGVVGPHCSLNRAPDGLSEMARGAHYGTVAYQTGAAVCPQCGSSADVRTVRDFFAPGLAGVMIAKDFPFVKDLHRISCKSFMI
jgi:hypothetical protein